MEELHEASTTREDDAWSGEVIELVLGGLPLRAFQARLVDERQLNGFPSPELRAPETSARALLGHHQKAMPHDMLTPHFGVEE